MAISDSLLKLRCRDNDIQPVQEFKYLGSWIEHGGGSTKKIKRRIGQATSALTKLKPIWHTSKCSQHLKLHLLTSNVMSSLLYGNNCWKLNIQLEKHVQAFENMWLRRLLNILWQEKVTNIEVCQWTGWPLITNLPKWRRRTYLGHVLQMPEDRLSRTAWVAPREEA